jgi:hypothetical protein
MRSIRVNDSEPVYQDLKIFAKKTDRKTAVLIGEALEIYRQMHLERRTSLRGGSNIEHRRALVAG